MSMPTTRRRRITRYWWQAVVLVAAVTVAVLLAGHTAGAVFTARTANGADQVTSKASFCASPGSATLNPTADVPVYESNATTNYGTYASIGTISFKNGGNARSLIKFSLPAASLGAFCTFTSATLNLYATTVTAGRTINVYQVNPADPAWTELGAIWNNQPGTTGSPVSSTAPSTTGVWQQWSVAPLLNAVRSAGVDNGLKIVDAAESNATSVSEYYDSRESPHVPYLTLTWG